MYMIGIIIIVCVLLHHDILHNSFSHFLQRMDWIEKFLA